MRREKIFPPLSATRLLALDRTHFNRFAFSAKLCGSSLTDNLSNIDESFFFNNVSSAVTFYNVLV